MTKFLIVMLLIMPWIFLPLANINDQFRLPQSCVMDIMFLGIIILSFYRGNSFKYNNKYLSWFIGWIFLNFAIYFFIPFAIETKQYGRSLNTGMLEPMIHILLGIFALQIILSNFEREDFMRIAKALCISSVIMSAFSILQYIGYDPMVIVGAKYNCSNQVSACLDNPNLVGNYLVLCLPLFLLFKEWKYGIGAILVISAIGATQAHFAQFLSISVVALYFLIKYRKNAWVTTTIIALGIIGTFLLVKFDFLKLASGMDGRLNIWLIALNKIKLNPLFGQGIGIWRSYGVIDPTNTHWLFVHNDWLERIIEIGLVGIIALMGVIIHTFRNFSYEDDNLGYLCMFTAFLVMMIGSFPWEVATIATLGLIAYAGAEKL